MIKITKLDKKMKELRVTPNHMIKVLNIPSHRWYDSYKRLVKVSTAIEVADALEKITGVYVSLEDIIERSDNSER